MTNIEKIRQKLIDGKEPWALRARELMEELNGGFYDDKLDGKFTDKNPGPALTKEE